ncbi:GLCE [Cordylochernes scorpioides]|uniref:GLCE n=1 Tax=Cordylochernes scorpioides TaxID=51811 RepID=A0ABY6LLG9_9ARAC|nr:GLCE [Cordylochernes scorpioides]
MRFYIGKVPTSGGGRWKDGLNRLVFDQYDPAAKVSLAQDRFYQLFVTMVTLFSSLSIWVITIIIQYFCLMMVYGRVVTEDGKDRLDWQHSYSRVFRPKEPYNPGSKYLWLESYNVEVRDRVKCISGTEGSIALLGYFAIVKISMDPLWISWNKVRSGLMRVISPKPWSLCQHFSVYPSWAIKRYCCKCMDCAGVPISLQWDTSGHIYPIQVAQYGLSHFSKNLSEPPPSIVPLTHWSPSSHLVTYSISSDGTLHFATPPGMLGSASSVLATPLSMLGSAYSVLTTPSGMLGSASSVLTTPSGMLGSASLVLTTSSEEESHSLVFEPKNSLAEITLVGWLRLTNGSLTAVLEPGNYQLRYLAGTGPEPTVRGRLVEYHVGNGVWLVRDFAVDLQKGVRSRRLAQLRRLRVKRLELRGHGTLADATLRSTAHGLQFLQAAKWLLHSQDQQGGWPIMVPRRLSVGLLQLQRGWYSAMAQGQAISLLTRAFTHTGEPAYLKSALSALHLFSVPSSEHGVRAVFMDKYPWFEEYPTTPASFVLNGFIFALFGLYDLSALCEHQGTLCGETQASQLFQEGLVSLKHMLLLFDTGSGTVYDLRHLQLGTPPNRARWDYHSTHINQLLWLATIDPHESLWRSTANRWASYMRGHRSAHN